MSKKTPFQEMLYSRGNHEENVKKRTRGLEILEDIATTLPSDITYGAYPKIRAKISSKLNPVENQSNSKTYENIRDELRNKEHAARERSPFSTLVSGLVISTIIDPLAKIKGLKTLYESPKLLSKLGVTGAQSGVSAIGGTDRGKTGTIGEEELTNAKKNLMLAAPITTATHIVGGKAAKVADKLKLKILLKDKSPDTDKVDFDAIAELPPLKGKGYYQKRHDEVTDRLDNIQNKSKKDEYIIPDSKTLTKDAENRIKLANEFGLILPMGQVTHNPEHINYEHRILSGKEGVKRQQQLLDIYTHNDEIIKGLPDKAKKKFYEYGINTPGEHLPEHFEHIAKKSIAEEKTYRDLYIDAYEKFPKGDRKKFINLIADKLEKATKAKFREKRAPETYDEIDDLKAAIATNKDYNIKDFFEWITDSNINYPTAKPSDRKALKYMKQQAFIAYEDSLKKLGKKSKEGKEALDTFKKAQAEFSKHATIYKPSIRKDEKKQTEFANIIENFKNSNEKILPNELARKFFGTPESSLPNSKYLIEDTLPHLEPVQKGQFKAMATHKYVAPLEKSNPSATKYLSGLERDVRNNPETVAAIYSPEDIAYLQRVGEATKATEKLHPNPSKTTETWFSEAARNAENIPEGVGMIAKYGKDLFSSKPITSIDIIKNYGSKGSPELKPGTERALSRLPMISDTQRQKIPTPISILQNTPDDDQILINRFRGDFSKDNDTSFEVLTGVVNKPNPTIREWRNMTEEEQLNAKGIAKLRKLINEARQ